MAPYQTSQRLEDYLQEAVPDEGVLLFDNFDAAFIGVTHRMNMPPTAVYDYDLLVQTLLTDNPTMEYEEAVEYVDFNVTGAYVGPQTPIVINRPEWVELRSPSTD